MLVKQVHQHGISSSASIKILRGKKGASNFSGVGVRFSEVSFNHFVQEHAHFVLKIAFKVGGQTGGGGQDKICPPLAPPLAWIHVHCRPGTWNDYYCTICYGKGTDKSYMTVRQGLLVSQISNFLLEKKYYLKNYPLQNYFTHSDTCLKS